MTDSRSGSLTGSSGRQSVPQLVTDAWETAVAYAKQETLEPLKGLTRFVAFGAGGSLALAVGLVVLLVAALRVLQTDTGTVFKGAHSWLPYLITSATGLVLVVLTAGAILSGRSRRKG
ncbi:MAG TPA: hypothetical protein VE990_07305 [Acidimicrobiales bacterium]|nr:hypothetical protein [Acidimicrobiales bacterium]